MTCAVCGGELPAEPAIRSVDRQLGTPGRFAVHVCPACGAGTTTPKVDEAGLAAFYPSQYGAYVRQRGAVARLAEVYYRWRDSRLFRRMPYRALRGMPAGRLVDVGCGRGDLGAVFTAHGWDVTGVEPSPEACVVVRERGMTAVTGTLSTVSLPERSFDVATFQHALEHTTEPVADLRRAHHALREGGVVLISVPNFGYWQRRLFQGCWYHLDLPRHRYHYTERSLQVALERAGFEVLEMAAGNDFVGLPASIQYAVFKRCLFPAGSLRGVGYMVCAALYPATWVAGRLMGGGDFLHVVARKRG